MPVRPAGEVERVVAVEMDVLVRERRDVLDLAGGDELAGGAELVEDALGVGGVPSDDRVDDDREAERLLALLGQQHLLATHTGLMQLEIIDRELDPGSSVGAAQIVCTRALLAAWLLSQPPVTGDERGDRP